MLCFWRVVFAWTVASSLASVSAVGFVRFATSLLKRWLLFHTLVVLTRAQTAYVLVFVTREFVTPSLPLDSLTAVRSASGALLTAALPATSRGSVRPVNPENTWRSECAPKGPRCLTAQFTQTPQLVPLAAKGSSSSRTPVCPIRKSALLR